MYIYRFANSTKSYINRRKLIRHDVIYSKNDVGIYIVCVFVLSVLNFPRRVIKKAKFLKRSLLYIIILLLNVRGKFKIKFRSNKL